MSEKDLCEKCKNKIIDLFEEINHGPLTPDSMDCLKEAFHCHHEPKEKEKPKYWNCWYCKDGIGNLKQIYPNWNLCPVCGRKL